MNLEELDLSCQRLAKSHPEFAEIYETYGCPPLWDRQPGFATLVHIILEQQVSLDSAAAAFKKLEEKLKGDISPQGLLKLSDTEMKACYFSRQKMGYSRGLAEAVLCGDLNLPQLESETDEVVRDELMKIKGIGVWTSDIYLIMVLLRPDVMPIGDIALYNAYRDIKRLEKAPKREEFIEIAEAWSPYRSAAARLLWFYYLSKRGRSF